jgi:hypothetical protein
MGDMFTYPQGSNPGQFLQQQIQSGAMPVPGAPPPTPMIVEPEVMDESFLFNGGGMKSGPDAGQMAWETGGGPAPWEMPAIPSGMPGALQPAAAPAQAQAVQAAQAASGDAKAVQAAQAAKVAADNAVRAAKAGAPHVAATNAATAQAAASVAAQSATSSHGQKAAAVAANEATKAVAAANVAVKNGNGMGDWMELSGMGAMPLLEQRLPVVGITYKNAIFAGLLGYGAWWLWNRNK